MDFFSRQDEARRQTTRLLALFSLAVVGVVLAVYVVFTLGYGLLKHEGDLFRRGSYAAGSQWTWGVLAPYQTEDWEPTWWNLEAFLLLSGATLIMIGTGAGLQAAGLAAGGRAVAERLGGVPVRDDGRDPLLRRLRNVTEEMAIASGTPVPELYVLENDRSINAFAAGRKPAEAVIGVTRGALEKLTRDELQGVIAHEFSHITNGDMRLNMRLAIMTHGILFVAITGQMLMRAAFHLPRGRSNHRNAGGNVAIILGLLAVGFGLMVIGSMGHFFAALIQAAISRQREFLADAAAVQFTRLPGGIAGALAKILKSPRRRLSSAHAGELGHFLFSGTPSWLGGWTATHPPLEERIRRIDPHFWENWKEDAAEPEESSPPPLPRTALRPGGPVALGTLLAQAAPITQDHAPLRPRHEQLAYARHLLEQLPPELLKACHCPFQARALVLALAHAAPDALVDDPPLMEETQRLAPLLQGLDTRLRLPLVDLAVPALRRLSPEQYLDFRTRIGRAIAEDGTVTLFEFALQQCLLNQLDSAFPQVAPAPLPPSLHSLAEVREELRVVLGALAYACGDPQKARAAYANGVAGLETQKMDTELPGPETCGLAEFAAALERLAHLTPGLRRNVLYAAALTVSHDGLLGVEEAEMIRALGDRLNTPVPPLASGSLP